MIKIIIFVFSILMMSQSSLAEDANPIDTMFDKDKVEKTVSTLNKETSDGLDKALDKSGDYFDSMKKYYSSMAKKFQEIFSEKKKDVRDELEEIQKK